MNNTNRRYSPEVRERAVRLVLDHQQEHESQWSAIESVASKIGRAAQTLCNSVRQAERDLGKRKRTEQRGETARQGPRA